MSHGDEHTKLGLDCCGYAPSHPDEHEAKAREWLDDRACDYCCDSRLGNADSLAGLLRSVAEDARREEAEKWERAMREHARSLRAQAEQLGVKNYQSPIVVSASALEDALAEILRRREVRL